MPYGFHTLTSSDVDYPPVLHRRCRMQVGDRVVSNIPNSMQDEGLRVGFTVEKSLVADENKARISIYNLNGASRFAFVGTDEVPVTIDAGYLETGLTRIFTGYMTNAVSHMDADGSYVTVLNTKDKSRGKGRKSTTVRPGVSPSRVLTEQFEELQLGQGNLFSGLGADGIARLGAVLKGGANLSGNQMRKMRRLLESVGKNVSVQDGQVQVSTPGAVLSEDATYLSPATGLEGAPEVAMDGTVTCRTRIVPGLMPGFAVELNDTKKLSIVGTGWWTQDWTDSGYLYKILAIQYTGDTWGQDWTAELKLLLVAR